MYPTLPRIDGVRLSLRLVMPDDAAYIHGLRTDPAYNSHLSAVTGTIKDQRAWIEAYKAREAAGDEVYYLITRKDGVPCGTVRLYDITADRFTWGSWILDQNKPPKAALESAVRVYEIGFHRLGCATSAFDVRRDNARTLAFHRRFGARQIGEDAENIYFTLHRDDFRRNRDDFMKILQDQAA
jgi:RimJ/RimL family protein N-acetyltransferase